MVHIYSAYGLAIHSALPLPELITLAEAEADVIIRKAKIEWPPLQAFCQETYFYIGAKEACLYWDRLGTFLVRNGREILIDPLPDVDEKLIRLPLLGGVLAVLLYQRRFFVLHASAVSIHGQAIAFIGEKGKGKSTLAAAIHGRGHDFMADDVVALDISNAKSPVVLPGFPQFKLWSEAIAFLLRKDPNTFPEIVSGCGKHSCSALDGFVPRPAHLKGIYVLAEGQALEIKPLRPHEAVLQLISNAYVNRFGNPILEGTEARRHFNQCTSLASNMPIYRLDRPRSLALLQDTAQLVEEQLLSVSPKLYQ
jgi:hypothetical protein